MKDKRANELVARIPIRQIWDSVGGLSAPSKMPGFGWSTSAWDCPFFATLGKVEGSVCSQCYARRGRYVFIRRQLEYRKFAMERDPLWVAKMVRLVDAHVADGHFRWHDSGELFDIPHLEKICGICRETRACHWLPTRNIPVVRGFLSQGGPVPRNLRIRVSATMIDSLDVPGSDLGFPTSIVIRKPVLRERPDLREACRVCPASLKKGGVCGRCRACWSRTCPQIGYIKH